MLKIIRGFKNKKLYIQWLYSYLSIMCIPLLISFFIYYISINTLKTEIKNSNNGMLEQVKQTTDNKYKNVIKLGFDISYNTNVMNLATDRDLYAEDTRTRIMNVLKDLRMQSWSMDYVEEFYIIYKNMDLCIASNSNYSKQTLYEQEFSPYFSQYNEWMTILSKNHTKEFNVYKSSDGQNAIYFMQSIPVMNNDSPTATIVIKLSMESFRQFIEQMGSSQSANTYFIDGENTCIIGAEPSFPFEWGKLTEASGQYTEKSKGRSWFIGYISSEVCNQKYLIAIPNDVYEMNIRIIQAIAIICLLLCIVLGFWFAHRFSKSNYQPVAQLVDQLSTQIGEKTVAGESEYNYINQAITHMVKDKINLGREVEKQKDTLMNHFLSLWLKGKIKDEQTIEDQMQKYHLAFSHHNFQILLFYVENLGELAPEQEAKEWESYKLAQMVISNVVGEILLEKIHCYFVNCEDILTCIIDYEDDFISEAQDWLENQLKLSLNYLEEHLSLSFICAVSRMEVGVEKIPGLYAQSLEILGYKFLSQKDKIFFAQNVLKQQDNSYIYDMEIERQMLNYIIAGDEANSTKLLNQIFQENFEENHLNLNMAKMLMLELQSTIIKGVREVEAIRNVNILQDMEVNQKLVSCETVEAMQLEMNKIIHQVCEQISKNKRSHNKKMIEEILKYVHENYVNDNLDAATVASATDISVNYLYKYFKDQMGEGLADYILKYRIEKAKELLRQGQLTVLEVAKETGFYNSNVFIRSFKKTEGITPGQYKDNVKGEI